MSLFLSFEGIEGSGKTYQAKSLLRRLEREGFPAILLKEPGGTELGRKLASILKKTNMDPISELFLFLASRRELSHVIRENLSRGKIVILDRFYPSTIAYQGYGRGIDIELITELNRVATQGLEPDLFILLNIDVEEALSRKVLRDRFEKEERDFHERVRKGYLELAFKNPEKWFIVDASKDKRKISQLIWGRVRECLKP